jgi:hypothetical protein
VARRKNDPLLITGLLILVVCGIGALLRIYAPPETTEAAQARASPARPGATSSDIEDRVEPGAYTGDMNDLGAWDVPANLSACSVDAAIDVFLGLKEGENALRAIGPYPREQWRAVLNAWQEHMIGWKELTIDRMTFCRNRRGPITWQLEEGQTVTTDDGVVYQCTSPGRWEISSHVVDGIGKRISFSLHKHNGRIWPKYASMHNFQPSGGAGDNMSRQRLTLASIQWDLAAFLGEINGPVMTMQVDGMDAAVARRWMDIWREEHEEFPHMRIGGLLIRRDRPPAACVKIVEPVIVRTWDGTEYEVKPDGAWSWVRPKSLPRTRPVRIMWLKADPEASPGPTALDNHVQKTPWQLLGLE